MEFVQFTDKEMKLIFPFLENLIENMDSETFEIMVKDDEMFNLWLKNSGMSRRFYEAKNQEIKRTIYFQHLQNKCIFLKHYLTDKQYINWN